MIEKNWAKWPNTVDVRHEERALCPAKRDIMPFFTPDIDSIDIAGRGSLEAEAVAQAIAEATTKAMTDAKKVKI